MPHITGQPTTGPTPEDLAELVYVHLELGDRPDGWARFWRELYRIGTQLNTVPATTSTVVADLDFLARLFFDGDLPA